MYMLNHALFKDPLLAYRRSTRAVSSAVSRRRYAWAACVSR